MPDLLLACTDLPGTCAPHMSVENTVLVIGAGGRMGAALARHLSHSRKVIAFKRTDLDILRLDTFRTTLDPLAFGSVVFTAGITNVDYCEEHPEEARLSNTEAPRLLAEICQARGVRFIHVSTDYVFDGIAEGLRTEEDPANPLSEYGKSKWNGERAVLAVSPDHLIVRVSWLFGPDRPAFPDMILRQALERDQVSAIADKWSCPTYSEDLARWIEPMLSDLRYRGILHLSNRGSASWQEFGQEVLNMALEMGLPLKAHHVAPLSRVGFAAFKAERPKFTSFDTSRFEALSGIAPRSWQEALRDYLRLQYGQA